jgi:L-alanine-DL-glutamate epimerase-like enolase superfamily enzyme
VSPCAAVPNAHWVEYIPQLDSLTTAPMRIEAGHAIPSDEAGLGIVWDFEAIKAQTVSGSHFVINSGHARGGFGHRGVRLCDFIA